AIDFESSSPVPGPRFLSAYTTDTGGLDSTQAYKSVRAHNAIYDLATIDGIGFGELEAQRSRIEAIEIEFDDVVTVDPAAFTIVKLGSGGGTVEFELTTEEVLEKTVATLQLSGEFVEHDSLIDGRYELLIDGDFITGSHGQASDVDEDGLRGGQITTSFHRYFADFDGDATVDALDFTAFRDTFAKSEAHDGFLEQFDFDNDGEIGIEDFIELRRRFGQPLA
ncbi:MAG: dockerin type I domain-containing protein, partial [Planctomycetota bacterium]